MSYEQQIEWSWFYETVDSEEKNKVKYQIKYRWFEL